jgi:hypothetical protein
LAEYDVSDVRIPQATPTDAGTSHAMNEVNQARQKSDAAGKDNTSAKQKQPDYLDFSAPIYPGQTSVAKDGAQGKSSAEANTPRSEESAGSGDKQNVGNNGAKAPPDKATEATDGKNSESKDKSAAGTESGDKATSNKNDSSTPTKTEAQTPNPDKEKQPEGGAHENSQKDSPTRTENSTDKPVSEKKTDAPAGTTDSNKAATQTDTATPKNNEANAPNQDKSPAANPVEDTNKAQKGGEASGGGGTGSGDTTESTGNVQPAKNNGSGTGAANPKADEADKTNGGTKKQEIHNSPAGSPVEKSTDLKPPSTPGHVTWDLSGNKTTKWDNGARQVENEEKGTKVLRVPTEGGGYLEQHWGRSEKENYFVDHRVTNLGTSKQFNREVNEGYNAVPGGVRKALDSDGFSIVTTNKVGDAYPGSKNERQAGYPEGTSQDNVPGSYDSKYNVAIIAENPDSDRLGDVKGVVQHEAGHAFDRALKDYSQSDEFKAAYNRDLAKIPDDQKEKLQYYIQDKDGNGNSEAFAEIFCHQLGCNNDPAELEKYFPETSALVKKKIKEAQ